MPRSACTDAVATRGPAVSFPRRGGRPPGRHWSACTSFSTPGPGPVVLTFTLLGGWMRFGRELYLLRLPVGSRLPAAVCYWQRHLRAHVFFLFTFISKVRLWPGGGRSPTCAPSVMEPGTSRELWLGPRPRASWRGLPCVLLATARGSETSVFSARLSRVLASPPQAA